MFPSVADSTVDAASGLRFLIDAVDGLDCNGSDAALIDRITALEQLKSVCAAAQARLTHTFATSQQADGAARNVDADTTRRSTAAQIALARRDSRHRGQQHVGTAHALIADMPCTLTALRHGSAHRISGPRHHRTIRLPHSRRPDPRRPAHRRRTPRSWATGPHTAAAAIAYRLDPEAVMGKIRGATTDRHVSLRPPPDTMSRLSALLPVAHGVAIYAALCKAADHTLATRGDRSRSQIMADELVTRVTGQTITGCDPYGAPHYQPTPTGSGEHHAEPAAADTAATEHSGESQIGPRVPSNTAPTADAPADDTSHTADSVAHHAEHTAAGSTPETADPVPPDPTPIPAARPAGGLQLNLIMTDRTLFDGDDEPAHLTGYGPIPAPLARPWSSATPTPPPAPGSAGSTPTPPAPNSSPWTPDNDCSPPPRRNSSSPATKPAAPPGATPPSDTWTTSPHTANGGPTTIDQRARTLRRCNLHQTRHPAGAAASTTTAPSPPPPPPATPTPANPHPCPPHHPGQSSRTSKNTSPPGYSTSPETAAGNDRPGPNLYCRGLSRPTERLGVAATSGDRAVTSPAQSATVTVRLGCRIESERINALHRVTERHADAPNVVGGHRDPSIGKRKVRRPGRFQP